MNDLERALQALNTKKAIYDTYFDYYDGKQPLAYANNKRLRDVFKGLDTYFAENWCVVVVDSVLDKVNLQKIEVPKTLQGKMDAIYANSQLALESDEIHESVAVTGEGFLICWEDAEGKPEAYWNDSRLCHVFYEAERPREMDYAAKWWRTLDGKTRMTLYYRDRLVKYVSEKKDTGGVKASSFSKLDEVGNPYGRVPIFHFRTRLRRMRNDLSDVIPVQNAINKLLTDMMVTAEFGAFPQRYVISNMTVKGKLKNAPGEVWDLAGGDGMGQQTVAGQFAAAGLDNYMKTIDKLATAISSITRTPKHYFFSIGSNLSGESLIAMEASLNKKAASRIERFVPVWQQAAAFLLGMGGEKIDEQEVMAIYDRPETVQPSTRAEARRANVQAGMPLVSVLREEGKSERFITQVMDDIAAEEKREEASLGEALLRARRQFDQGGNG